MSYKVPAVPNFTGLYDIDKRLQNLAQYLSTKLTWLDYSFGLADRLREIRGEDDVRIYPGTYLSNTEDPFDCHPSDEHNIAFWIAEDNAEVAFADQYSQKPSPLMIYNVSLIVFINLSDVPGIKNELRSARRNEITEALNAIRPFAFDGATVKPDCIFSLSGIVENDIRRIYEGFTYEDRFNTFKQLPFYAARFNGTLSFRPDCD